MGGGFGEKARYLHANVLHYLESFAGRPRRGEGRDVKSRKRTGKNLLQRGAGLAPGVSREKGIVDGRQKPDGKVSGVSINHQWAPPFAVIRVGRGGRSRCLCYDAGGCAYSTIKGNKRGGGGGAGADVFRGAWCSRGGKLGE